MVLRKLFLVIGLCLLTACGVEKQQPANDTPQEQSTQKNKESELVELRKSVKDRYDKAADKWLKKLAPITKSIAKDCRQKLDKAYIECIDKKNDELIESSFFPDLVAKMLDARKEFDQKLIKKKITKNEFFENAAKLQNKLTNDVNDRINNDVKSGTYTGKY